ncbi:MAG: PAC2 family protein [Deltaproteobacteria bacterium]
MEDIKLYKRPKLKNVHLIVAWPGMGEVAHRAVSYLLEKLPVEELGEIPSDGFFYPMESIIQDGVLSVPDLPTTKLYFMKDKAAKRDLLFVLSDAQPDGSKAEQYCERLVALAKLFKVKKVISFAAMPQPMEHSQRPSVWFTATSKPLLDQLKKFDLQLLSSGQISGLNGLFLGIANKEGFEGFCLLGEIPLYTIQIENPKASYAVLEALARVLTLHVDFSELLEQAQAIETQINGLLDYLKMGPSPGPIGEEEIEKIKKSLSQLTKLPVSVKDRIEKLFGQAKSDLSKANELKAELDKWNVYKEYEDRFLDLFKKTKGKNN